MFGYLKYRWNTLWINSILDNLNTSRAFAIKIRCLNRLGHEVKSSARIMGPLHSKGKLIIGNDTFIGTCFRVEGNGTVEIGDNCDIAPQVTVLTGSHKIGNLERRAGEGFTRNTSIGSGTWIGACSVIMPGIKIGDGCIIGAGALVVHDVPDNYRALGVPAKNSPIEK